MRRVVITGMGVFASTGKNADSFFATWPQGRSAIRRIQQFDPSALSVQIAAEVPDYDPLDYFPAKRLDLLDRFSQFALLAAKEAMDSSGIQLRDEERPRFGVVTGTGMGGRHHVRLGLLQPFRQARHAPASFYHPQDHAQRRHLANLHGVRRAGTVADHRHGLLFLRARHRGSVPLDQIWNGRLDADRGDAKRR